MSSIVTADPRWARLGSTSNADVFEIEPRVIAVVPRADAVDDADTARESIAFQDRHWASVSRRGAVVVFMDNVLEQTSGARQVYASETGNTLSTCYALVGATMFAQATSAAFTGLSKPQIPTQIFRSLDDARPWIEEVNGATGPRE